MKLEHKGFIVKSEWETTHEVDDHTILPAKTSLFHTLHFSWVIDSDGTAHMAQTKSLFFQM